MIWEQEGIFNLQVQEWEAFKTAQTKRKSEQVQISWSFSDEDHVIPPKA